MQFYIRDVEAALAIKMKSERKSNRVVLVLARSLPRDGIRHSVPRGVETYGLVYKNPISTTISGARVQRLASFKSIGNVMWTVAFYPKTDLILRV